MGLRIFRLRGTCGSSLSFLPCLDRNHCRRLHLAIMKIKTVFPLAGGLWEILRFTFLFLLLLGAQDIPPREGNFLIFLLALSGFPFTLYLWGILVRGKKFPAAVLAGGRLPSLFILGLAAGGFILGRLPAGGDRVFLENSLFSPARGWLVLVMVLLIDLIFTLNLLLLLRKEA